MKITGACHCGAIAYEGDLDLDKVGICHCTDCQSLSASAYHVIAMVAGDTFQITKGSPRIYVKTADSGNRRRLAFCENCSSSIYSSEDSETPPLFNIRADTMHQRQEIEPKFECWRDSALPWMNEAPMTRKFGKNPA